MCSHWNKYFRIAWFINTSCWILIFAFYKCQLLFFLQHKINNSFNIYQTKKYIITKVVLQFLHSNANLVTNGFVLLILTTVPVKVTNWLYITAFKSLILVVLLKFNNLIHYCFVHHSKEKSQNFIWMISNVKIEKLNVLKRFKTTLKVTEFT